MGGVFPVMDRDAHQWLDSCAAVIVGLAVVRVSVTRVLMPLGGWEDIPNLSEASSQIFKFA